MDNNERIKYLDEKHKEISKKQEESLYIDFDESIKDKQKEGKCIIIKIMGKEYKIPSEMPFNFSTFYMRYCYKKIGNKYAMVIPDGKLLDMLELMLPNNLFNDLCRNRKFQISQDDINDLIIKIMKIWGYGINPEKAKELEKKMLSQG